MQFSFNSMLNYLIFFKQYANTYLCYNLAFVSYSQCAHHFYTTLEVIHLRGRKFCLGAQLWRIHPTTEGSPCVGQVINQEQNCSPRDHATKELKGPGSHSPLSGHVPSDIKTSH